MSEDRTQALIRELRDFRTRSAASKELIAMGRAAVRPLLDALKQEGLEGARWAAIHCLGELGAAPAVPAIAPYLGQSDYQSVAHEALVKIAGCDLGPLPGEWIHWAEQQALETGEAAKAGLAPEGAGPSGDARLMELALAEGCATYHEREPNRYAVSLPLAGGATQEVLVIFGAADHEGSPIVIICSDCGDAHHEHYETVLRPNLRMPYGAIALRDVGGKPYFVVFNTILRQALTPIELRKSIFTVGEGAHRVERELHH